MSHWQAPVLGPMLHGLGVCDLTGDQRPLAHGCELAVAHSTGVDLGAVEGAAVGDMGRGVGVVSVLLWAGGIMHECIQEGTVCLQGQGTEGALRNVRGGIVMRCELEANTVSECVYECGCRGVREGCM